MRAAQALEEALSLSAPGINVHLFDALEFGVFPYRRLYRSLYLFLARRLPRLLDLLYRRTVTPMGTVTFYINGPFGYRGM